MIKRNIIKALLGAVAAAGLASCGGSQQAETPTATLQVARTKLSTRSTAGNVGEEAGSQGVPPPTIGYDDSAARRFWAPVPVGQTPAEWEPEYLTREERTKYQPLVDPDPAAWDIPAGGVTPEYAARVASYLRVLISAIVRVGVAIGTDDPRVRASAAAAYAGDGVETFLPFLDESVKSSRAPGAWRDLDDFEVLEVRYLAATDQDDACMFVHMVSTPTSDEGSRTNDRWKAFVRDSEPNWLNPTGWRELSSTPSSNADLSSYSCEAHRAAS